MIRRSEAQELGLAPLNHSVMRSARFWRISTSLQFGLVPGRKRWQFRFSPTLDTEPKYRKKMTDQNALPLQPSLRERSDDDVHAHGFTLWICPGWTIDITRSLVIIKRFESNMCKLF